MPSTAPPSKFVDTDLMKALADELRVRVYAYLCEHTAGSKEIATALDADRGMVRHHLTTLKDGGWIDAEPEGKGRETEWRAVRRMVIPAAAWDRLPEGVRQHVAVGIMRTLYDDTAASMEAGFYFRPGGHLSITPMVVDAQGQRDTKGLLEATVTGLEAIQADSSERMTAGGRPASQGVALTVALAGFESLRSPGEGVGASLTMRL